MKQVPLLKGVVLSLLLSYSCSTSPVVTEFFIVKGLVSWSPVILTASLWAWSEIKHRCTNRQVDKVEKKVDDNGRSIEANGKAIAGVSSQVSKVQSSVDDLTKEVGSIQRIQLVQNAELSRLLKGQDKLKIKGDEFKQSLEEANESLQQLRKGQFALGSWQGRHEVIRDHQFKFLFTSQMCLYQELQKVGDKVGVLNSDQQSSFNSLGNKLENIGKGISVLYSQQNQASAVLWVPRLKVKRAPLGTILNPVVSFRKFRFPFQTNSPFVARQVKLMEDVE